MSNEKVDIAFEDSREEIEFIPKIKGKPKCAKGSTFCEDFELYPYDRLENELKIRDEYKLLFGKDEFPAPDVSERFSGSSYVCSSIQKTVFPNVAKNRRDEWKIIVNQVQSGFVQGISVELCRREGRECDVFGSVAPPGYITSCKQKYTYRRLLSLSYNGELIPDTFELPSACCCSYTRDINFMARIGQQMSPVNPAGS